MKKTSLLISLFILFITSFVYSQNYKKVFFKDLNKSTDEYDLSIVDQLANDKELKFKIKITNKTKDILLIKPSQISIIINDKEYKNSEKDFFIDPFESKSRVINYVGMGFLSTREFSIKVEGIYVLPIFEKTISVNELALPPAQNEFKAGDFLCTIIQIKKQSDETNIKFKCRYEGSDYGVISINKPSVLMPDGNKYATAKTKENNLVLKKGEEENFSVVWKKMPGGSKMDMQKVPMTIFWNETFSISKAKKISNFEEKSSWDEQLTFEKGR
ncbi:MAG: hypothetical protein HYU67_12060 [Flavobacteriia bacterium]|nr:hypothetical protein [Flavobacteriia bacterium]